MREILNIQSQKTVQAIIATSLLLGLGTRFFFIKSFASMQYNTQRIGQITKIFIKLSCILVAVYWRIVIVVLDFLSLAWVANFDFISFDSGFLALPGSPLSFYSE